MMPTTPHLLAQVSDYLPIAILILLMCAGAGAVLLLSHLLGPKRKGPIKDMPYESGMDPEGDTRRRFNVRFYIVAMLFLLFDVEIVFFYPWATLFPRLNATADGWGGPEFAAWAITMQESGFGHGFFMAEMLIFIGILLVGYVYAWRKGVFRWD
jgi:NADH-quinone oxidoreductase subunit A